MNKAKINELAKKSRTAQSEVPAPKAAVQETTPSTATPAPANRDALLARLYVALVGGSDFLRTQASEAEICRTAYRRAETALKVWRKERAARTGEGDKA